MIRNKLPPQRIPKNVVPPQQITYDSSIIDLAISLREKCLPDEALKGIRISTEKEFVSLIKECVNVNLPVIYAGKSVGSEPKNDRDKMWCGRMLERFLGGKNDPKAHSDFEDTELKSTRVIKKKNGKWGIEQVLRITTISHDNGDHLKEYEQTPFYEKISHFNCVLFDSIKNQPESGSFVGHFIFDIKDDPSFETHIKEDYYFYLDQLKISSKISNKVKSPNGFLICRETGDGIRTSKSSFYITKDKFDYLLDFYGVNKKD